MLVVVVLLRAQRRISRATGRVEVIVRGLSILASWRVTWSPVAPIDLLALQSCSRLWLRPSLRLSVEVLGIAVIGIEVGAQLRREGLMRCWEAGGLDIARAKRVVLQ